ncbi:sulfite exporter TauE/SafE family protein [uncultured Sphingomonas sp.]|uniref:sulfite exporter TauE/SafE family protein n=1 Tax=uncultured Sphingomonas sp. TaxID=158754 RepID=UPI0025F99006|nr:sulfite exporter TauE/SafE family protein [uncultured Sphingomonas sp.]
MIVLLLFVTAFLAFVVSAVAGGGAGLVLIPLLRLVVPVASVPAALSIGTAASSLSRLGVFRRHVRWDVVRRFVPTALPAAALGAWLLTRFDAVYVELMLGGFLLFNLPALFRRMPVPGAEPLLPLGRLPWLGAAAGLLSGFTGAVGVVFNRAYYRMGLSKDEIVATRATNEVLLHLLKLAIYAWFGLLTRPALVAGAVVAGAAMLASVAAPSILGRMRESLFRRAGLAAMVASGIALVTLSTGHIMAAQRAWIAFVAPGDEQELQLYWQGRPRAAVEHEAEGGLSFERPVSAADLPHRLRAALPGIVGSATIIGIEEVFAGQHHYEIRLRRGHRIVEIDLPPDDGAPTA